MPHKLPINRQDLLRQRTVEGERIEYKAGWNPDTIIRTLCAFANDFENLSGSRCYRNRRIGEFLKELKLTEGRSTGVPRILRAMAANGSPAPQFETDDDRLACFIRLPAHPLATRPTTEVTMEVARLLAALQGDMTRAALQEGMGLKNAEHFRKAYLPPALSTGMVEMTLPDKPNSRSQSYRLTAKGQHWLARQGTKP